MSIFKLEEKLKPDITVDKRKENLSMYSKNFGLPIAYVLPLEKLMFLQSPYETLTELLAIISSYINTLWRTYRCGNNIVMYIEFKDFICKLDVDKTIINCRKNLEPVYIKLNKEDFLTIEFENLVAEIVNDDTETIINNLNILRKFLKEKLNDLDIKHYLMNILLLIKNEKNCFKEILEKNMYKNHGIFHDINYLLDVVTKDEKLRVPYYFENTFLNSVSKNYIPCYKNINIDLFSNKQILESLMNLNELLQSVNYNKEKIIYAIYMNKGTELPIKHINKKLELINKSIKKNYYNVYLSEYKFSKTAKQKVMYYELFLNRRFILTEKNFIYGLALLNNFKKLDNIFIQDLQTTVSNSINSKLTYRLFTIPSKYDGLNKLLAVQIFNFITDLNYCDIQEEYFEYADYISEEKLNVNKKEYKTYKQLKLHILNSMYELEPNFEKIVDKINYENYVNYLGILDKNILNNQSVIGAVLCSNIFKEWVNIGNTYEEKQYLSTLFKLPEFNIEEISILSNIYTKFKYNVNKLLNTHSINDIITDIDKYVELQDIWLDLNDIVEDLLGIKELKMMDKIEYIYKQILIDNT